MQSRAGRLSEAGRLDQVERIGRNFLCVRFTEEKASAVVIVYRDGVIA